MAPSSGKGFWGWGTTFLTVVVPSDCYRSGRNMWSSNTERSWRIVNIALEQSVQCDSLATHLVERP